MGRGFKKHACKLVIGFRNLDPQTHHRKQARFQRFLMLERRLRDGHVILVKTLVEGLDQVFLGTEVVVGVTERHAGFLCDRAHRRLLVTKLAKHVQRGFKDQRLCLVAFTSLRRLLFAPGSHRVYLLSPATLPIW